MLKEASLLWMSLTEARFSMPLMSSLNAVSSYISKTPRQRCMRRSNLRDVDFQHLLYLSVVSYTHACLSVHVYARVSESP